MGTDRNFLKRGVIEEKKWWGSQVSFIPILNDLFELIHHSSERPCTSFV